MKCRITITGHKIWRDNDNKYGKRPPDAEIKLLRDGEEYKNAIVDSDGDGEYTFACLPVRRDAEHKYVYKVLESDVPAGYEVTMDKHDIINTLRHVTLDCSKTWDDEDDAEGKRPTGVIVYLYQNGKQILTQRVDSPAAGQSKSTFTFENMPVYDDAGVPHEYTLDEEPVPSYEKTIKGFDITNTYVETPN